MFDELTFVIPFYFDGNYRLENLNCILNILGKFNANVIVIEQGDYPHFSNHNIKFNGKYYFIQKVNCDVKGLFYRTHIINTGLKLVQTKYAAIYDTDVFFTEENYIRTYKKLIEGYDFVYPYDGRFGDIDRQYIANGIIKEPVSMATGSYGGAVFFNLDKYKICGLENENIIGWGAEDFERHERIITLGYSVCRLEGKCYHIYHPHKGINSSPANPFNEKNQQEYQKVKQMNTEQLQAYIKTWAWAK